MNSETLSISSALPLAAKLLPHLETELRWRQSRNRLRSYRPYTKQAEFHAAGLSHRERAFLAGNQLGKTVAGGSEAALHLTGRYPDWWKGKRFAEPVRGWAAGVTSESTRDNPQRILLGPPQDRQAWGTGTIPADAIASDPNMAMGIAHAVDSIVVKHVSGGQSVVSFKAYEKGREKWQGETLHFVWYDEEPPPDIYSEGVTRTNATGGITWLTATPLLGMSEVVRLFYPMPSTPDRHLTQMTIDDAEHYTPEERARIVAAYPEHEREARASGIPMLGSGRIFPIPESDIKCQARSIPEHWPQIGGMDFGWDHPFAATRLAWDRDTDTVYVTAGYRVRQQSPIIHAAALKPWGLWLPWAWPRDGKRDTLEGAGVALAEQFKAQGLNMLQEHAQFPPDSPHGAGSVSVEAGVMEMLTRMQSGRWKVFDHLNEWFDEFRMYHREDGLIVKEHDDLLCSSRYAMMMLRRAITKPRKSVINYPAGLSPP
jgi:phage terminase large subunit-like protein